MSSLMLSVYLSWARLLYTWQFVTHVIIVTHIHTWHDVSHYTHSHHQTVCDVYTYTPQSVTYTHLRVRDSCNNCDAYTHMTWRVSLYTSTPCDCPWRIHIYTWDSVSDQYIYSFFFGGLIHVWPPISTPIPTPVTQDATRHYIDDDSGPAARRTVWAYGPGYVKQVKILKSSLASQYMK